MKILNFTAVEILPALLSKAKLQTIRPAWGGDINKGKPEYYKEPRFKVADKVRIVWNQRSKYDWFCKGCGKGFAIGKLLIISLDRHYYNHARINPKQCFKGRKGYFSKYLGNAEITEVFKIEISKSITDYEDGDVYERFYLKPITDNPRDMDKKINIGQFWEDILAKLDGFSSAKQMFAYFDKKYDLSQPKAFWVYRFKLT